MLMRALRELFGRPMKAEHIMEDELFGKLTWSEKYGGWRGTMTLAERKTVAFTVDGVESEESVSVAARKTFTFLSANEPLISAEVALSMSEFYNETWGRGEDPITPEEMALRITLTSVSFYEEGGGQLYYEAIDDLFASHTICASIDANGVLDEPVLEG